MKAFRIISVALLVLWMFLIFSLSSQDAVTSSNTSGEFITSVINVFTPEFKELSVTEQESLIESYQFLFRKAAHFTLYAILGIFAFLSVVTYNGLQFKIRVLISMGICIAYSLTDEMHQIFVSGRSAELRDVFIDICGSFIAILIVVFILKRAKKVFKAVL